MSNKEVAGEEAFLHTDRGTAQRKRLLARMAGNITSCPHISTSSAPTCSIARRSLDIAEAILDELDDRYGAGW